MNCPPDPLLPGHLPTHPARWENDSSLELVLSSVIGEHWCFVDHTGIIDQNLFRKGDGLQSEIEINRLMLQTHWVLNARKQKRTGGHLRQRFSFPLLSSFELWVSVYGNNHIIFFLKAQCLNLQYIVLLLSGYLVEHFRSSRVFAVSLCFPAGGFNLSITSQHSDSSWDHLQLVTLAVLMSWDVCSSGPATTVAYTEPWVLITTLAPISPHQSASHDKQLPAVGTAPKVVICVQNFEEIF